MWIQHLFDYKIVCAWRVAAKMMLQASQFRYEFEAVFVEIELIFFFHRNHFSVHSFSCCYSATLLRPCVCLVKPPTMCHRCEHEYFDYYCYYFVWCVLGTKIQIESHIIDLTHRCVNSRCNVTHFKWYVCVFSSFLFCYAYHSIVFVELCWMFNNNYMFSLRQLVWLICGSDQMKLVARLLLFIFCHFKKGWFSRARAKRAEIDFFLFTSCIAWHNCQIDSFEQWIHLWKKNANTRMTSNMCQNTHCRRLLGMFVKPLKL